jgi:hypothetical protein
MFHASLLLLPIRRDEGELFLDGTPPRRPPGTDYDNRRASFYLGCACEPVSGNIHLQSALLIEAKVGPIHGDPPDSDAEKTAIIDNRRSDFASRAGENIDNAPGVFAGNFGEWLAQYPLTAGKYYDTHRRRIGGGLVPGLVRGLFRYAEATAKYKKCDANKPSLQSLHRGAH